MTDPFFFIERKMREDKVSNAAIDAFRTSYGIVQNGGDGLISESDILAAQNVQSSDDLHYVEKIAPELLNQTVVIKLNGGLGTSMGLQKAKSLLEVKEGVTFLDIIAQQIIHLRESTESNIRCLLMNGFSTSADTLAALRKYEGTTLGRPEDLELLQNKVPKLVPETMQPVEWPENPELEWCPPGHADLYAALSGTGMLDKLLSEGVKYAFVSNSDNLGAVLDFSLLSHFANEDLPFLMEVTQRTEADRKGGHVAMRKSDGQLLLREVAQCPEGDLAAFQDIEKHQYFNTNNIWIRLDVLKDRLEALDGALPLPVIRNKKTVDPRDPESPAVVQLETAMGAAIECFPGSAAINVPRTRFAPVKTTADLLALRSNAYVLTEDAQMQLALERGSKALVISLSDKYKLVESIVDMKLPSLISAKKIQIDGAVVFEECVTLSGDVHITRAPEGIKTVSSGVYEDCSI